MEILWNSKVLDLRNLQKIARQQPEVMEKYLRQFEELIPSRINHLAESLAKGERKMIRQILHKMSPQLQFFGIPGVIVPIQRMEHEYETMPWQELQKLVETIIAKLILALAEVEKIIADHF